MIFLKRLVLILSFSILIVWIYLAFFFQDPFFKNNPRATFTDLIEGKAHRPFVSRRFLLDLSKSFDLLTPNFIANPLKEKLSNIFGNEFIGKSGRSWVLSFFYANIISLLFLILSGIYIIKLGIFLKIPDYLVSLIFTSSLIIFINLMYIYDFVSLFLFMICFYKIINSKNFSYLFFFALCTYNKETSLFLLLFYVLLNPPKTKTSKIMIFVQILIYFLIRSILFFSYINNPGKAIEFHFDLRLQTLLSPLRLEIFFSNFLIFLLAFAKFKEKPLWIQKGLILFPIYFILYLIFGIPGEIRVFLDIYPIIFLSSLHTIKELLK